MADQNLSVGLDVSQLQGAAKAFQTALKDNSNSVQDFVVTMAKFNEKGKLLEASIRSVTAHGEILDQTIKRTKEGFKIVGTTAKNAAAEIDKLAESQKKAAETAKLMTAHAIASPIVASFDTKNVGTASTAKQAALSGAQGNLVKTLMAAQLPQTEVQAIFDRIKAGFIDVETGARQKVQKALLDVKKAFEAIDGAQDKAVGRSAQAKFAAWQKANKDAAEESGKFAITVGGIGRLLQALVIRQAAFAFAGFFTNLINEALEYQKVINKIDSTLGRNGKTLGTADLFFGLQQDYDVNRVELAKTAHVALGNQLRNTAESYQILRAAVQLEKVTSLSEAQSIELVNQALRTNRADSSSAADVAEKYFNVLQRGNVNTREFTAGIEHMNVTARDLGVSMEQSLTFFTRFADRGYKTRDALSSAEAVMNMLLKPTAEMQKLFQQWGVVSGQAAVATFGFVGVLQKLQEHVGNTPTSQFHDISEGLRGIRGAVEILGDPNLANNLGKINDEINKTVNNLRRATEEAKINRGVMTQWWIDFKAGTAVIGDAVGGVVNPPLLNEADRKDIARRAQERAELEREAKKKLQIPLDKFEEETQGGLQDFAEKRRRMTEWMESIIQTDKHVQSTLAKQFGAFTGNIGAETKNVKKFLEDISREYDQAQKRIEKITATQDKKVFERSIAGLDPAEQGQKTVEHIRKLDDKAIGQMMAKNFDGARDTLREIDQLLDHMFQQEKAWDKKARALGISVPGSGLSEDLQKRNADLQLSMEQNIKTNQGMDYQLILEKVKELAAAEKARYDYLIERAKQFKREFPYDALPPSLQPSQQQAMGGFIQPKYFASGGPVGTDTIPAWLSRGEYVMDAANTSKFFPQLVSMSMGIPSRGGSTSSVNVGDININYQATDSQQTDVRRLGEQLRREIRRGTLRLN